MFAIEVDYLLGRVIASQHDDRESVEWPPHPTRLFSALVAAYHECDLGGEARNALKWLEEQPHPPEIFADPPQFTECGRDVYVYWVPINDNNDQEKKDPKTGKVKKFQAVAEGVSLRRQRAERHFPAFTPANSSVWFFWPEADAGDLLPALKELAENVTYLGHSMSPVRLAIHTESCPVRPNLIPDERVGDIPLRVPSTGRLIHLEKVHKLRMINTTHQPHLGRTPRYRVVGQEHLPIQRSLFTPPYIFRCENSPYVPITSACKLAEHVRRAVMGRCRAIMGLGDDTLPEVICGHTAMRENSQSPHMAVTPLPSLGHQSDRGRVMGFAIWLPNTAGESERDILEEALYGFTEVKLGQYGVWTIEQMSAYESLRIPFSLRPKTYTKPSTLWASVTPVLFGHFPDRSRKKRIVVSGVEKEIRLFEPDQKRRQKVIAEMCQAIGLTVEIADICLDTASVFPGIPKASGFLRPDWDVQSKKYFLSHVRLRFNEKVRGPILMGAGRFSGLGVFRPLDDRERT